LGLSRHMILKWVVFRYNTFELKNVL
jgi:hypothetical protein